MLLPDKEYISIYDKALYINKLTKSYYWVANF